MCGIYFSSLKEEEKKEKATWLVSFPSSIQTPQMALSVGDVVSRCVRVSGRGLVGVELIYNSPVFDGGS